MSTHTLVPPQHYSRQPSIIERVLTAMLSGVGLFFLAVVVFLVGFQADLQELSRGTIQAEILASDENSIFPVKA